MFATTRRIIGLDGVERAWDEVFATYSPDHTLDNLAGYVVRQTFPGEERAHEDVRKFGAHDYAEAVELARRIRSHSPYAVIDRLYENGDRTNG